MIKPPAFGQMMTNLSIVESRRINMKYMRVLGKFGLLIGFVCLTATMTYATDYTFVGDGKWDNPGFACLFC